MKRGILLLICSVFSFCAFSATISVEQLYNMLINATPTEVHLKRNSHPPSVLLDYMSNGVPFVDYYNKKGALRHVVNSPSLEIKITPKDGRKRIYFFDTVILKDSATIEGCESRIMHIITDIKLDNIELIEFTDGGKNYNYR